MRKNQIFNSKDLLNNQILAILQFVFKNNRFYFTNYIPQCR